MEVNIVCCSCIVVFTMSYWWSLSSRTMWLLSREKWRLCITGSLSWILSLHQGATDMPFSYTVSKLWYHCCYTEWNYLSKCFILYFILVYQTTTVFASNLLSYIVFKGQISFVLWIFVFCLFFTTQHQILNIQTYLRIFAALNFNLGDSFLCLDWHGTGSMWFCRF